MTAGPAATRSDRSSLPSNPVALVRLVVVAYAAAVVRARRGLGAGRYLAPHGPASRVLLARPEAEKAAVAATRVDLEAPEALVVTVLRAASVGFPVEVGPSGRVQPAEGGRVLHRTAARHCRRVHLGHPHSRSRECGWGRAWRTGRPVRRYPW